MTLTTMEPLCAGTLGVSERPLSPAAIAAWQVARLRAQLGFCRERSSFYRRHLQGVDADAVQSPADVAALPGVTVVVGDVL